jgi:hypothetical protein
MMDLRETIWSRGSHCLRGRHRHYLLAHLLCNNHTSIRVNGAPAITMMTSLPIHLSNHSPQALERNLSAKKKPEAKTDEETEGSVRKEVKDFFEKVKERRK